MKPILEVNNISKHYKIGAKRKGYLSLRDLLMNGFKRGNKKEDFWALQNISFDANPGDCIGIVGRNGAGKSTLLKVLSKITPPSKGIIRARGRIASLLEVGTGFHPELTGRENIYLNGSILGLKKTEINRNFDKIIDFSGVETFLDTALKHYSSGMKLRLAFSVAAHLEPEILLIDEVLAVGDTEFQKKCIGKMDEVSKSGRTIIFVSHDLDAVRKLCKWGIMLEKGQIEKRGEILDVVDHYLETFSKNTNESINSIAGKVIFNEVKVKHINIGYENRKMNLQLDLEGKNLNKITSIIINIFALSGKRISLVDLRHDLKLNTKNQSFENLSITSITDFERYIEGLYNFTIGIEYNNTDWFESEQFGFELLRQKSSIEKYAPKYRGYFELDTVNEIVIK